MVLLSKPISFIPYIFLLVSLITLAYIMKIDISKLLGTKRNIIKPLLVSLIIFSLYVFIAIKFLNPSIHHYSNYYVSFFIFTVFVLFQATCEELVFRSYFLYFLENYNIFLVAFINSIIFGLLHYSQGPIVILGASLIAFIFVLVDKLTNNYYYSYVFHIINNIVSFNIVSTNLVLDEKPLFVIDQKYPSLIIYLLFFLTVMLIERKNIILYTKSYGKEKEK